MPSYIVNAAPMVIDQGTDDQSIRQIPLEPIAIPQHFPLVFGWAKKGPLTRQPVVGASRINLYHADSFDLRKKWANHATVFSNLFNANANLQNFQRLKPDDAGPDANVTVWVEVANTNITQYNRDANGNFLLDNNGAKIASGTTLPGIKYRFSLTTEDTNLVMGSESTHASTLGGVASTVWPLFTVKASSFGEWGNNAGLRIWGINENVPGSINRNIVTKSLAYPFRVSMIARKDAYSSATTTQSMGGEQSIVMVLKPAAIDPDTTQKLYLGDNLIRQYSQTEDPRYPQFIGDVGEIYIYEENVADVLGLMYDAEKLHITASSDITGSTTVDERFMINLFGCTSSYGTPYYTLEKVAGSTPMTSTSNIWMQSGSDGTMDNDSFAALVDREMDYYLDDNNVCCDSATNPITVIYDSGFPLDTKLNLFKVMGVRKDIAVIVGTHDASSQLKNSAAAETALAATLRAAAQLYPESEFFGTPTCRAAIMGRSGVIRNSLYTGRLPGTYELAHKFSRYMGASDGRWKSEYRFAGAPNHIVETMYQINVTYTGRTIRNMDWDAGLNWIQSYDHARNFIPSYKTVYTNDTSVLNNVTVMFALCTCNRIAYQIWRDFSGVDYLTAGQLIERLNETATKRFEGIFDDAVRVVPDAQVTAMDDLRGFSWFLNLKLYANNQRTVMTTRTTVYRMSDYAAAP